MNLIFVCMHVLFIINVCIFGWNYYIFNPMSNTVVMVDPAAISDVWEGGGGSSSVSSATSSKAFFF